MIHKHRVGVVRGGPSSEYQVSLDTGANVLGVLRNAKIKKYDVHDIFIDRSGKWHFDGLPVSVGDIHHRVDAVFNALHGTFGEDGKIQHIFESLGIPMTGSDSLSSAVGMNKRLSKEVFANHDILTPLSRSVSIEYIRNSPRELHEQLFNSVLLPVVVKPLCGGSSVGISIVRTYGDFAAAFEKAAQYDDMIMIEDLISGVEATCGVIEGFRGEELYALPPIEIRPHNSFFDYEAKYGGKSEEIVPATFPHKIKEEIQELTKKIHRVMGLRHYSRSDFIIHEKRGIYTLEVNTLPGLTDESLVPKSLRAVGSNTSDFVHHILDLVFS